MRYQYIITLFLDVIKLYYETDDQPIWRRKLGPYSKQFILFSTYECSESFRVFCSWEAFLAWCNVTLELIGPICKLRRNWSVVNTVPGVWSKQWDLSNMKSKHTQEGKNLTNFLNTPCRLQFKNTTCLINPSNLNKIERLN